MLTCIDAISFSDKLEKSVYLYIHNLMAKVNGNENPVVILNLYDTNGDVRMFQDVHITIYNESEW